MNRKSQMRNMSVNPGDGVVAANSPCLNGLSRETSAQREANAQKQTRSSYKPKGPFGAKASHEG